MQAADLLRFTFISGVTGQGQFKDCGEPDQFCEGLNLIGENNGWVRIDKNGGSDPDDAGIVRSTPGIELDTNCDGVMDTTTGNPSTCFQVGLQCDDGGFECTRNEEAEGRLESGGGGQHESFMNSENDSDNDGWPNDCDNCPDTASADQTDTDDDGHGDICDNCPEDTNPDQADGDGDGTGDACETEPLDFGPFTALLGDLAVVGGNCDDTDGRAALVAVGQDLVLRGFGANDDIPLTLNDAMATGDNVLAFDVAGHELTMNVVTEGLFAGQASVELFQPVDFGFCFTNLVPLVQDCFSSTGQGTISLDVADTTCAGGIQFDLASGILDSSVVELPQSPYTTDEDISTELVQLELSADGGATFGEITIRLRGDVRSTGAIENVVADDATGEFISGDRFLDVFIEVEIAGMGLTLNTGSTPFRLEAGSITELPPLGNDYLPPPGGEPLMLFTVGTTDHIGWFWHAQHTPTAVVPCP